MLHMLAQPEDPLGGLEPCAQLVHINRLGDEIVRARFHAFEVALFAARRSDQQEITVAIGRPRAHPPAELRAIDLGHLPIGDDNLEVAELQVGPRLATVLRFGHFVPEAFEHRAERHARDGVVFGEEQVHRVRPGGFEPPTNSLEGCCSIHLSYGRALFHNNLMRRGCWSSWLCHQLCRRDEPLSNTAPRAESQPWVFTECVFIVSSSVSPADRRARRAARPDTRRPRPDAAPGPGARTHGAPSPRPRARARARLCTSRPAYPGRATATARRSTCAETSSCRSRRS